MTNFDCPLCRAFFIPRKTVWNEDQSELHEEIDCPLCRAFFIPHPDQITVDEVKVSEPNRLPAMSGFFHSTYEVIINENENDRDFLIDCPLCRAFFIPLGTE